MRSYMLYRWYLLSTLLYISLSMNAQTGCPSIDAQTVDGEDAVTVDCDNPCVTLESNVFETGSTETYDITSIPFAPPFPPNAGTSLFINIDDTWSPAIDLPFEFCYFGINYNQIVVGSNGVITFDAGEANGYCPWAFNETAPDANLPTNAIFGVYHDIDPSVCGAVRYELIGEEPCRTFVVNYDNVCHFSCDNLTTTTQVVFYETTNAIDIYVSDKPTCGGWNSGNALLGIQNATGTVAYVPAGRNTGSWSTSSEAWRFTPSGGAPTYTVTWFEDGNEIGTGNTIDLCPTQSTTYTAEAVYDGCGGNSIVVTDDIAVTVDNLGVDDPDPTILVEGVFCTSEATVNMQAVDGGGVWTASCGACIDADSGVIDLTLADLGDNQVSYTVVGECGDIFDNAVITVVQDANAAIDPVPAVCSSEPAFTVTTTEPGGTFSATCGACIDPVSGVFDPFVSGPGDHAVSYTIDGDCPDTQSIIIEVINQDVADFNVPAFICENAGEVAFTPVQAQGDWSASCGDCIDPNTGLFDPAEATEGSYDITYTFDSSCPDQVTQSVEVIDVVAPVIEAEDPVCTSSDPVDFEANVADGTWSADCVGCIDVATGEFNPAVGANTYTITYTVGVQCPVSDTEQLEVLPQLSAAITTIDTLCTGGVPVQMEAVDGGGTWSSDCFGCIDPVAGTFDPGPANPGTYQVTYSITGLCGDLGTSEVIVDAQDDATILQPASYCLGWGDVQIESIQNGGNWSATCGECIDPVTGVFNTGLAGVGNHEITYSFSGVCGDAQSVFIDITPNDDSSISESYGFCIDEGGQQLEAATPGGFWTASCDNCVTAQGIFSPGVAGIGEHTITYTIPGPCGTESTETISVFGLPNPGFTVDGDQGCIPFAVNFVQDSLQNANCLWSFGDGTFSAECSSVSHTYNTAGCFDVSLTLTSFEGCENSVSFNDLVCGLPNPDAGFTYSPASPTTDEPVIDLTETAEGEIAYNWTINDVSISDEPFFSINLANEGAENFNLCLEVIDGNGCTDLFCRDIELLESLRVYVPSVFTPDGDGVNEVWFPVVLGVQEYDLKVFNRWGDVVFQSITPGEPWLGEYQKGGYFCPDGVYSWYLKIISEELEVKEYSGQVTILR